MILSRLHNFVFVKAHKVGGTSVEMALATICGPDDIITPISPIDEIARMKLGVLPRNYSGKPEKEKAYIEEVLNTAPEDYPSITPKKQRFRNHMPFYRVQEETDVDGMRVIAVTRSPYGLVVSWATHRVSFREYRVSGKQMTATADEIHRVIDSKMDGEKLSELVLSNAYRGSDGKVDIEPLRQEHLADDFNAFVASLKLDKPLELPRAKPGMGLTAREAHDMLRPDQRARIAEIFAEDIANFGDGLS